MHVATCVDFHIDVTENGGGTGKSDCIFDHEPDTGDGGDIYGYKGSNQARRGTLHPNGYR